MNNFIIKMYAYISGVSGAGQSNLSTGVAALLQDQLLSGQNRSCSPEEPDFLELDFDPGSDKSDLSSEDSGQGRDDEDIVHNSVSEAGSPPPPRHEVPEIAPMAAPLQLQPVIPPQGGGGASSLFGERRSGSASGGSTNNNTFPSPGTTQRRHESSASPSQQRPDSRQLSDSSGGFREDGLSVSPDIHPL